MRLKNAVEYQFLLTFCYAAGVIAFADGAGPVVTYWLEPTQKIVDGFLFLWPSQDPGTITLENTYRHLFIFSILLTGVWLWICQPARVTWGTDFIEKYRHLHNGKAPSERLLQVSYGTTLMGAFCAAFVVLKVGFPAIPSSWLAAKWTFFRAPLLTTIAFALICYALTFSHLLDRSSRS